MPSDITTPATFSYTAGSLRTLRIAPASFAYSASSSLVSSKDSTTSSSLTVPDLDRLTPFERLLNEDGTPSMRFMAIWQTMCEQIEASLTATNAKVDDNTAILARLTAAEALAEAANDSANAAQTTANNVATATQTTFQEVDPVYSAKFQDVYGGL